ncbi:MAG: hypothetical protein KDA96_08655, partial [Planctomycetaceae bacterium]|nr:hypothetical protein [Planctomycetaceae bacterium]
MADLSCFAGYGLPQLLDWMRQHAVVGGFEHSVRLVTNRFDTGRCLISIGLADLSSGPVPLIVEQCQRMSVPATVLDSLLRFLPGAAFVHFGFEQSRDQLIGKCYLELPPPEANSLRPGRLQFLGFKWSMNGSVPG